MKSINLVALQPFEFEGRSYVRDQVFEVRPVVAAALTRARSARFATDDDQSRTIQERWDDHFSGNDFGKVDPDPPAVETAKEATVKVRRPRRKRRDISKAPRTKAVA